MNIWKVETKDGNVVYVEAESFTPDPTGNLVFGNTTPDDLVVCFAAGTWVRVFPATGIHTPAGRQANEIIGALS